MTEAIGSSAVDVARALAAAQQATQRSPSTDGATESAAAGRTGNEGDSVTLSEAAQQIIRLRDGTELTPLPLDKLRLVTPQGLRSDAEAGLQAIMANLGIEDDLEFSFTVNDDGSIAVESEGSQAEALESAINADPALQKTLREMEMFSRHSLELPAMKTAIDWMREHEDEQMPRGLFDQVNAVRERIEGSHYTATVAGGTLTTAFVDAKGESFGGVDTEIGLDGRWA